MGAYFNGATQIGSATVAPYAFSWGNVAIGSYNVTAIAFDDKGGSTTSAPIAFTVKANVAPAVSITSPSNNAAFYAPGSITLTAAASDSDRTVKKVEFHRGTILIGSATSAPFTVNWANVPSGTYTVTAKATDDKGAVTTSSAITLQMQTAPVPTVSITAPANNTKYAAPAAISFTANAAITGDTISKVEYISAGNVIGSSTTPPYTINLHNVVAGAYSVTVVVNKDVAFCHAAFRNFSG